MWLCACIWGQVLCCIIVECVDSVTALWAWASLGSAWLLHDCYLGAQVYETVI